MLFTKVPAASELFQSTPSAWRETPESRQNACRAHDFNPLPPHGGRLHETDRRKAAEHFNPLPPHGGRPNSAVMLVSFDFISIHSLRMEGDLVIPLLSGFVIGISIHSLRMEGDARKFFEWWVLNYFNPLPPHGGRQFVKRLIPDLMQISIHSLRMEGDTLCIITPFLTSYFNPLPPHGGRHVKSMRYVVLFTFQSTPSAWRETSQNAAASDAIDISIHSLRMEGDC